jgi:hypothetical protein
MKSNEWLITEVTPINNLYQWVLTVQEMQAVVAAW